MITNRQELPKKYYVYKHIDPVTEEIFYIGKGSMGRAWACGKSNNTKSNKGMRSLKHYLWMQDLTKKGFTPADWVVIVDQKLTNKEALNLEAKLVNTFYNPKQLFNITDTSNRCTALNKEKLNKAITLRQNKISYEKIAEKLNVSTMTVYRALNGITKGYKINE